MRTLISAALMVVAALAGIALAQEKGKDGAVSITLPDVKTQLAAGAGKEKAEGHCAVCHSLDYITMQPKGKRAQWTGTVNKMIKTFGAPIPEADSKIIIDYLVKTYGIEN